jgi:hypothetical protein
MNGGETFHLNPQDRDRPAELMGVLLVSYVSPRKARPLPGKARGPIARAPTVLPVHSRGFPNFGARNSVGESNSLLSHGRPLAHTGESYFVKT